MKKTINDFDIKIFVRLLRFSKFELFRFVWHKGVKCLQAFQIGYNPSDAYGFYLFRILLIKWEDQKYASLILRLFWFGFVIWKSNHNEDTGEQEPNRGVAFYCYFGNTKIFLLRKKWILK